MIVPSFLRADLRALAERLPETPLTLVSGPAGAGKSTLLAAWREALTARGVPVADLHLARWHADAGSLCADLVDALASTAPGFGGETRQLVARVPDAASDWPVLLRGLLREWTASGRHAVVMLDGWHALAHDAPGLQLADELLAQAPPSLRFVVSTRGAVPRAALRLRASEQLLEVGGDDLALHADQVSALLAARGVDPEPDLVARLLAHTEGWATGVVLAARLLALAEPADRHGIVSNLARQRDLLSYVAGEVLRDEPPERLALLECAALLGRATPAALAQVNASPESAAHVADAQERGLLQGDGREVWLPPLWSGLLRERLTASQDADVVARRRRAAAVLVANERVEQALDLLGDARDWEELTRVLVAKAAALAIQGRRQILLDWLEQMPQERRAADPDLLMIHGGVLLGRDPARAQHLLEEARRTSETRAARFRRSEATSMLAVLHFSEGRIEDARAAIRSTIKLREIATNPSMRGGVVLALAGGAFLAQRFERGLNLCERALRYPLNTTNRWLAAMGRTFVHLLLGEWERARGIAEEAMADGEIARIALFHETLRVQRALALARGGRPEEGRAEASSALEVLQTLRADRTKLFTEMIVSEVWLHGGDAPRAVEQLSSIAGRLERLGHHALEAPCRAALALALFVTGDASRARTEAERADALYAGAATQRGRLFAWVWLRALWVLAATGSAALAEERARENAARFVPRGLPLVEYGALLLRAEIARLAGRAGDADRHARDAWRVAAAVRLTADDSVLSRALGPWSAERALAQGVDADYVVDRLRERHPRELPRILGELSRHDSPRIRGRAVVQMGRLGDRAHHAALVVAERDGDTQVRDAAKRARASLDPAPRYHLRVEALGRFRVLRDGEEIADREWRGQTTRRLLLRLLVADGRPVSREALIEDLWPDADPDDARGSLRVAVSRLNDALEPDRPDGFAPHFVVSAGETLAVPIAGRDLAFDGRLWESDASAARQPAAGPPDTSLRRLREAFDAWDGRFAPEILDEAWLLPLRRRLEEGWAATGRTLAERLLAAGQIEAADAAWERLLARDATDERAWAARVRIALRRSDRTGAARLLEIARERLLTTLDVPLGTELTRLAAELRGR